MAKTNHLDVARRLVEEHTLNLIRHGYPLQKAKDELADAIGDALDEAYESGLVDAKCGPCESIGE